ncbi:hypothetical protein MJM86_25690, partial [Salmonella enterica subsp. enterica serovar Kentucky]|nr:hypothetical protein [Salmonella enterica subsp. enterica serovar Kentucky]
LAFFNDKVHVPASCCFGLKCAFCVDEKLNVTATQDTISFDIAWLKPINLNNAPKQSQWMAVFNEQTET